MSKKHLINNQYHYVLVVTSNSDVDFKVIDMQCGHDSPTNAFTDFFFFNLNLNQCLMLY